jgi:hypothetical protein
VRVNASGTAIDYTASITGVPTSVAADVTGAAFVAGFGGKGIFLAHFAPDGAAGFFSSVAGQEAAPTVALDNNGEEVVYASGKFQRYDASGALVLSLAIQSADFSAQGLLLDTAGNAYVAIGAVVGMYPVRNTLAACGTDILNVVARDGTVLQTTYIPGAGGTWGKPLLAMGADSNVLIVDSAGASFAPTQNGPFAGAAGGQFLLQLSQSDCGGSTARMYWKWRKLCKGRGGARNNSDAVRNRPWTRAGCADKRIVSASISDAGTRR